jgi:hypothetical protein
MTVLDPNIRQEIRNAVCVLLDGTIQEAQFARLHHLLESHPAAQDFYLDFLEVSVSLRKLDWTLELESPEDGILDQELWSQLAYTENNAPAVKLCRPQAETIPCMQKPAAACRQRPVSKLSVVSLITSLAAMLLLLCYAYFTPQSSSEPLAVMTDGIKAVWGNTGPSPKPGDPFLNDSTVHTLLSGSVKIESVLGPELIIEGPALFEFPDMNKVLLHSGRIYANVPKNAIGYSVLAPSFTVIDLGTEFGVSVDADGSGDVLMFSGKASLVAGRQGDTSGSHMLTEGSAKRVFAIGHHVEDIPFVSTTFVRQLDSAQSLLWRGQPLNLADLVGGGNGFGTGQIGSGIDPLTGKLQPYKLPDSTRTAGNGFTAVAWNPFVDGIFVPDGGNGPVQISTRGDAFVDCPDTDGNFWIPPLNGGRISDFVNKPIVPLVLNDLQYGTPAHPAILLHSNLGITFDLQAIGASMPGISIAEFRSLCGISSTSPERFPYADFWVLVDGKVRFSRRGTGASEVHSICVPIKPTDRFLTLATTDGGMNVSASGGNGVYPIDSDWCLFAEPYLILDSTDLEERSTQHIK